MRMGVNMATTKFPVQLAAVVMDTAMARTSMEKISLVTTHATGLSRHQSSYEEL